MAERVGRGVPLAGTALSARVRRVPPLVWFVALVVVVLVAGIVVTVAERGKHPVTAQIRGGYTFGNPAAISVQYEVTKSTLATSRCTFEADDVDHDAVGTYADVVGPTPHNQRTTIKTVTIPTTAQAVDVEITGCTLLHVS